MKENKGGLYRGIKMSPVMGDIIVGVLGIVLLSFIVIAIIAR